MNWLNTSCCLSCGGAINYSQAAEGEVCVDLGSGRGTDVMRLAETVGKDGFVFGIDISEGMIRKAVSTAERLGIKNVEFIQSPLEKIKLPDNKADLVISNCTINHSDDKQAVWNEIFRILKTGGRFVVSDIYSLNTCTGRIQKRSCCHFRMLGRIGNKGRVSWSSEQCRIRIGKGD